MSGYRHRGDGEDTGSVEGVRWVYLLESVICVSGECYMTEDVTRMVRLQTRAGCGVMAGMGMEDGRRQAGYQHRAEAGRVLKIRSGNNQLM